MTTDIVIIEVPGAQIEIIEGTVSTPPAGGDTPKIPSVLEQTASPTVDRFDYDPTNGLIIGSRPGSTNHVYIFDAGGQGLLHDYDGGSLTGFAHVNCILRVPSSGLVFLGRNDAKLSILNPATLTLPVNAGSIDDMDCCLEYSTQEDLVYSIGNASSGNKVYWNDPTTGAHVGHVTNNGDTSEDPPLKMNALAFNPGDKNIYWLSVNGLKLSVIDHTTHVHSHVVSVCTDYAGSANGGMIFGSPDGTAWSLWAFAGNGAAMVIYKVNLDGSIAKTITTGLGAGDVYLRYDSSSKLIYFSSNGYVGTFDCVTEKVLGRTTQGLTTKSYALTFDSDRKKLWQANHDSGYTVLQM